MTTANNPTIARWVSPAVRAMHAYQRQPTTVAYAGLTKLDAMENPYAMPAELQRQWREALQTVALNRYPDPSCADLAATLRQTCALADAYGLVLGNGSDELLLLLALLLGGRDRTFIAPTPTFVMYQQLSIATGTRFVGIPLRADFSLDETAMLTAIDELEPACIFLANPNNPTGNYFAAAGIAAIIERAPGVVVVDEAYFAFGGRTVVDDLARHANVMVLRTLSKEGLAGLRLGMLIAHPDWCDELEKIRLPYNINTLTQLSATFYLRHYAVMQQQVRQICDERARLYAAMRALPDLTVYPSETNFLLFRVANADRIFTKLQTHGLLIKNLHPPNEPNHPLTNCLRVTIGTPPENNQFLTALMTIV